MADDRGADERRDDALNRRIARLEGQVSRLRQQALQLKFVLVTASAVLALLAIAVGLFLPFVRSSSDGDGDSITLLPAIFALADAGDGPFETQAIFVAVLVGIFALAAIVTAIAIACLVEHPPSAESSSHRSAVAFSSSVAPGHGCWWRCSPGARTT